MDLIRLHVLGVDDYDAVAFYDADIEFQGDISDVFLCASTGRFITASGGVGEPMNVGFFALKPDKRYVDASLHFAQNATFNRRTGWSGSGFLPAEGYFNAAECGQGFMHTLFFDPTSAKAQDSMRKAGLPGVEYAKAVQIDRCIWNYQTDDKCGLNFDCDLVQVHHKPNAVVPPGGQDCAKLKYKLPKKDKVAPLPVINTPCMIQKVIIGQQCDCDKPKGSKTISTPGLIVGCQEYIRNPSGDSFKFNISRGKGDGEESFITATRHDKPDCWCDPRLEVECCIVGGKASVTL